MAQTKRSILQFVSKRYFQPRPAKNPLPPPYTIKTKFDYSKAEPLKNYELAVRYDIYIYIYIYMN